MDRDNAEVLPTMREVGHQQATDALIENYRREMLSPDVAGRPAKIREIKQKYQELGLQTDQVQLFGND